MIPDFPVWRVRGVPLGENSMPMGDIECLEVSIIEAMAATDCPFSWTTMGVLHGIFKLRLVEIHDDVRLFVP